MKVTVRQNAKINLTLDVVGVKGRFHEIKSLVASIDLVDAITVIKRNDNEIVLKEKGIKANCEQQINNAYRAAAMYKNEFKTSGVTIIVEKAIPVAGGLGGSSADAAGVLKAMQQIFDRDTKRVEDLADKLGSDTRYMLRGGYAVMEGRGERLTRLNLDRKLYLLLITNDKGVDTKDCYNRFDELALHTTACTEVCSMALVKWSDERLYSLAKNDLYIPAKTILPEIEWAIKDLKRSGANLALMTGSGATTFGVYETAEDRDTAFKVLKPKYKDRLIKTETVK